MVREDGVSKGAPFQAAADHGAASGKLESDGPATGGQKMIVQLSVLTPVL